MRSSPKLPTPIPPANPATPATAMNDSTSVSFFQRLSQPLGIFTSTAGLTERATGQKRSLIGG